MCIELPWPGRIGGFESGVGEDGPSLMFQPPRTKSQRLQPFSALRLGGLSTGLSSLSSFSIDTYNNSILSIKNFVRLI